ncbi:MAG TPA: phage major capsid protein, partial [Acidobacteriota bacterium]|nr:phage major capsid protein [Acidobacteriota bacterium]
KVEEDVAEKIGKIQEQQQEQATRLQDLEQKAANPTPASGPRAPETLGQQFMDSERVQKALKDGMSVGQSVSVELDASIYDFPIGATAVVNAPPTVDQPLVAPPRVPGIVTPAERRLMIRDLLPVGQTGSNLVPYTRETQFDNQAAPQGDPGPPVVRENQLLPESGFTFDLQSAPVETVGHVLPMSEQVLEDAPQLRSHVDSRMRFGLALKEEGQLLNGDGNAPNLNGLNTQATAYDVNLNQAGDTLIDQLAHAILQVALSEYFATGVIMHPKQWHDLQLIKTTGTASSGEYIIADPRTMLPKRIWGVPVVDTLSQPDGDFTVGAFMLAAQVWDRRRVRVLLALQHSDYFARNMVLLKVDERLALTVYRPAAIVKGTFV